jgi:hypothetical protein
MTGHLTLPISNGLQEQSKAPKVKLQVNQQSIRGFDGSKLRTFLDPIHLQHFRAKSTLA